MAEGAPAQHFVPLRWASDSRDGRKVSEATPQVALAPYSLPQQQLYAEAIDALKFWLASSEVSSSFSNGIPTALSTSPYDESDQSAVEERCMNRFLLPNGDSMHPLAILYISSSYTAVSCVHWNGLYFMTGTDIVRGLNFRFQAFGRPVTCPKKFEEGVFSDLRNLKSGSDAQLEEPKSDFIDFLFRHNCVRTQKKQKVFYWYSVPQDRLFLDALERDLKRDKLGQEVTSTSCSEPALSFNFDPFCTLFDRFANPQTAQNFGNEATLAERQLRRLVLPSQGRKRILTEAEEEENAASGLLEGSPHYKNRRHPPNKKRYKSGSSHLRHTNTKKGTSSAQSPVQSVPPPSAPAVFAGRPLTLEIMGIRSLSTPLTAPVGLMPSRDLVDSCNFVCPLVSCGRLFKRLEHLRLHITDHGCDRPHACHRCPKRFSRTENLQLHNDLHYRIDAADAAERNQIQQEDSRLSQAEAENEANERAELIQVVGALESLENPPEDVSLPLESAPEDASLSPSASVRQELNLPDVRPMPSSAPPYSLPSSGWPLQYHYSLPATPLTASNTLGVVPIVRAQSVHSDPKPPSHLSVDIERRRPRSATSTPTYRTHLDAWQLQSVPMERSQSFDSGLGQETFHGPQMHQHHHDHELVQSDYQLLPLPNGYAHQHMQQVDAMPHRRSLEEEVRGDAQRSSRDELADEDGHYDMEQGEEMAQQRYPAHLEAPRPVHLCTPSMMEYDRSRTADYHANSNNGVVSSDLLTPAVHAV